MSDAIIEISPLGAPPWQTSDPFLFCVHHLDNYPEGNEEMGPDSNLLTGRNLGNDFSGKDGWSMYHGQTVPGFPQHPHRGFETVTIARQGFIDHTDSLGAKARFGEGDVQWMTAGEGIVHSEMFPLVNRDEPNPTELFQIWLNLSADNKLVDPHFAMFWNGDVPKETFVDDDENETTLTVIAGTCDGLTPPEPPPESWASEADNHVAIWTIELEPDANWTLPTASEKANRSMYVFDGGGLTIGDRQIPNGRRVQVDPTQSLDITNGDEPTEILVLQGRPIDEPVAQQGPFVMNDPGEIREAMLEYRKTRFGGWPWDQEAPVHPRDEGRFAVHIDGREEKP